MGALIFFIGAIVGAIIMAFMQGTSICNRETEIYMEGYLAGQVSAFKEVNALKGNKDDM